jgi:hypothetical protein
LVCRKTLEATLSVLKATENLGEHAEMVETAFGIVNALANRDEPEWNWKTIEKARFKIRRLVKEECPHLRVLSENFVEKSSRNRDRSKINDLCL